MTGLRVGLAVLWSACACVCAGPGVAGAETPAAVAPGSLVSGPFLAGPGVGWTDATCGPIDGCSPITGSDFGELDTLRVKFPGRRPLVLNRQVTGYVEGGEGEPDDPSHLDVHASGRWKLSAKRTANRVEIAAGPVDGEYTPLVRCSTAYDDVAASSLLSGDVVAYPADPCRIDSPLTVRNLATGEVGTGIDPGATPRAANDRWLVTILGGVVRVRDWRTGVQLGRDLQLPPDRELESADVDIDGSVAELLHRARTLYYRCDDRVLVYPAASASGNELTEQACPGRVHIDGGRTTFLTNTPVSQIREIGSGGASRSLARLRTSTPQDFDADAESLVFATARCDGQTDIWRHRRGGPAFREGSVACPFRLTHAGQLHGRVLRLGVQCPRGCRGTLDLRRGKRHLAGRTFSTNRSGRVGVRLSRSALRMVRRPSSHHLVIRSKTLDRAGRNHRALTRLDVRR